MGGQALPGMLARRLALALALGVLGAGASADTSLTPGQMRALGFQLAQDGFAPQALAVADALLSRDPADAEALIIRARALRDLGRERDAVPAARAAWAQADGDSQKFAAAMTMAQALASGDRRLQAQLWLRRAADLAPTPQARAIARRDFAYVRSRNPLRLQFELAVAPSSNVNNGTRHTTVEFLGLPFEIAAPSQALSGWTAQAGVSGRYRLSDRDDSTLSLRFAALHRAVWLSAQSKAALEQWRLDQLALGNTVTPRTDYSNSSVEFGIQRRQKLGQVILDLGAGVSHNWSGGQPFSRTLRFDLGVEVPQGRNAALFGALGAERQWRADGAQYDADILTLQAGMANRLANGDTLRLGFGARRSLAVSRDVAHEAVSARLAWQKARPLAGVRVSASLGVEHRRHPASVLAPAGRRDTRLDATLSLGFDGLARMGFAPTLDIHTSRNRSNNVFHDGRQIGLSLGFRSVF